MSTVAEIKQAFTRLPKHKKVEFARWLQSQTDDRLNDEQLMKLASQGARTLDRREAAYARRKAR